jgi:hypothetical protein
MIRFFQRRFDAKTSEQNRVVDNYIAPLIRQQDDEVVIAGDSTFAHIWWTKKPVA